MAKMTSLTVSGPVGESVQIITHPVVFLVEILNQGVTSPPDLKVTRLTNPLNSLMAAMPMTRIGFNILDEAMMS